MDVYWREAVHKAYDEEAGLTLGYTRPEKLCSSMNIDMLELPPDQVQSFPWLVADFNRYQNVRDMSHVNPLQCLIVNVVEIPSASE